MADKLAILEKIKQQAREAVLSHDFERSQALKYIASQIEKYLARKGSLSDSEVMGILNKEMKSKKEALTLFLKGERQDLAEKEKEEIKILESFLPKQASEEEVRDEVRKIISDHAGDFGRIMGVVMEKFKGRADGSFVSKIVKEEIQTGGN